MGIGVSRIREFIKMNPSEYCVSKMDEDPSGCIEEVYKVLAIMEVYYIKKAELAAYKLKRLPKFGINNGNIVNQ